MNETLSAEVLDVIVVGAGPAGLNAALVLARARRRILVLDSGAPRNAASHEMHGYLSRDKLDPAELRRIGRAEVLAYPSASLVGAAVAGAERTPDGFLVRTQTGDTYRTRKLLLAVGIRDELPEIPGLSDFYGTTVFHCPYCDGWESRDRAIALLGTGSGAVRTGKLLLSWTSDVVVCTGAPGGLDAAAIADLEGAGVRVDERRISQLIGSDGQLSAVQFEDGTTLPRDILFFHADVVVASTLPAAIGCAFTDAGRIEVDEGGRTSVAGVSAVGDCARRAGQHPATQVIIAAASGSVAAITLHQDLMAEDVGLIPALPDLRPAMR
ncbi:MAG TPA: NAD(P)/FAD-dependent oxidoreductase [Candidatus Dormibacteraeota bacterium]